MLLYSFCVDSGAADVFFMAMLVFIESTICLAIELIVQSWSEMRISDFVTRLDSRQ